MTPIKPETKTKVINWGKEPMESFWLEIPAASSSPPSMDYESHLNNFLESGVKDGAICVFSEELSSRRLCELLAKARDNGCRVYILANDFNEEMKNLNGCLIRYGGKRKTGSFILINPNSNTPLGCLFTGHLSDGSILFAGNVLFDLDAEQIAVLFRYFCHQFWNCAEKERIGGEGCSVDSAPLDIYPPSGDGCDFQYLQQVWREGASDASITTSLLREDLFLKFDNFSNSTIVSLYTGIDNDLVRYLKQKNNTIIAVDDGSLVNSVKTEDSIWLVPKIDASPETEVYALRLNSEQAEIFNNHISKRTESKNRYQYNEQELRENLAGKTIVKLGDELEKKYTIRREDRINIKGPVPSELFPKDRVDAMEPNCPDNGRSVSITYEWTNIPFALPPGSSRHSLYQEWKETQEKIASHIGRIQDAIAENNKKEKFLSNLIKQFFLGKQQKFKEYGRDLEELKKIDYASLEKAESQEKIARLNEIHAAVIKDSKEIDEENRKASISEKIEAKENEKKNLESDLTKKEAEIDETKKSRESLENVYYAKGYIKKSDSLVDFRKKLEKQIEETKKNAERIRDDLETWQTQLDETKERITALAAGEEKEEKLKKEADLHGKE
jgi:hypothetical protein